MFDCIINTFNIDFYNKKLNKSILNNDNSNNNNNIKLNNIT